MFKQGGQTTMKPQGVKVEEWPDIADIRKMGAKSSVGKFRGKGGDFRGYFKSKIAKAMIRRSWKKRARRQGKQEIIDQQEQTI